MVNNTKEEMMPVLSFFTGGGFLDMGFEKTNFFEVIWTNEKNPYFAELYTSGYTSWNKSRGIEKAASVDYLGSIESINPEHILIQAFGDRLPKHFGIIGGPPCQDFSNSGKHAGFKGERGRLTKVFIEYIQKLSPLFFVIENVKNLYTRDEHKRELVKILANLKKSYFIDFKILNSIHYNVPQDRSRLFILGIKKPDDVENNFLEHEFKFPAPPVENRFQHALTKYSWPTIDRFQNGVIKPEEIPEQLYVNNYLLSEEEEGNTPNGDEYFKPFSKKFWEIKEGDTRRRSFKRLHRYRFSPTACYGNNEVHLHPFLPRRLSVREVMRIQSVPESYIVPTHMSLTQKFKMIGNAVPVNLAHAIAETLREVLKDIHKIENQNGTI